jgi:hypothetical protein
MVGGCSIGHDLEWLLILFIERERERERGERERNLCFWLQIETKRRTRFYWRKGLCWVKYQSHQVIQRPICFSKEKKRSFFSIFHQFV